MTRNLKWKVLLIIVIVAVAFWKAYPPKEKINLGLDLQGGMHLVLRVDLEKVPEEARRDAADRALEVIRNRIDQFGVREPSINRQGRDRIVVQLPGITDRERAINLIGRTALLEFKLVYDDPEKLKAALAGDIPEGYELKYTEDDQEPLLLEKEALLTGDALNTASLKFDPSRFNEPVVGLEFNAKGARKFARITGENIGRRLAIVLDDKLHIAPRINERIPTGQAIITGRFTQEEATDIAIVLRAGALPAPIDIEEERTVGPTLGRDSIEQGVRAIIIGGIFVLGFMAIYYLLCGLIADFALCLNLVLLLGALSYLQASLTLPGIAGITLTLGMAVDANVLIFERVREELKVGKHIRSAIIAGYNRAILTILDANITTLITALILFWFGTGPVRGFATTLSIGIVASMFTAIIVSRVILDLLTLGKRGITNLPMLKLIKDTKIDFIGKRRGGYFLSILVIVAGLIVFGAKGKKNFGVEFTGGALQQFKFEEPVEVDSIRQALSEIGLAESTIQEFGGNKEFIIRTLTDSSKEIKEKFSKTFAKNRYELVRIDKIGPIVGKQLTKQGIYALFFALIGICLYVGFRFEFDWAFAAIVALFHDVLVAIAALAFTGRAISLPVLAGLLTIVGYSINDTIVVFDRIREDLKLMRKSDFVTVINTSINQTLSRTLLTSLTTLLVVLAIFFLGGVVINDFAFVLLVGVISGTYSSIFVASPIIVDWGRRRWR